MSELLNDPMGQAIVDFAKIGIDMDIIVTSDLCDDDVIPVSFLFREFEDMPELERLALSRCTGKTLDVGAGAGMHALYLNENGFEVACIDTSPLAVEYLKSIGLRARNVNFFDVSDEKYDTLLFMMNGIGIAGTFSNLENTLFKAKEMLNPGGKILCDSSDIKYLYEDEEGAYWFDLNSEYYGNFKFQMKYQEQVSEWFDWLYVDFDNLKKVAENCGFSIQKLFEDDNHYLAELVLNR